MRGRGKGVFKNSEQFLGRYDARYFRPVGDVVVYRLNRRAANASGCMGKSRAGNYNIDWH